MRKLIRRIKEWIEQERIRMAHVQDELDQAEEGSWINWKEKK